MNKTIVATIAISASILAVFAGCLAFSAQGDEKEYRTASNRGVTRSQTPSHKTVVMNADFDVMYTSVTQLAKVAHLIVQGKASDVSYFDSNGVTYTKVIITASKVFKGDIKSGSNVMFIEIGGVTTEAAMIRADEVANDTSVTPEQEATKVDVLLSGAPLTEEGDDIIYFGTEGDITFDNTVNIEGNYYQPIGAFQGKFDVSGATAERYLAPSMAGSRYRALRMDQGAIRSQVRDAVAVGQ